MNEITDGTETHKVDGLNFKANPAGGYALYWAKGVWKESQWMKNDALSDELAIKKVGIPIAWVRENICELVVGDEVLNLSTGCTVNIPKSMVLALDSGDTLYSRHLLVTKFAERKNTGEWPVAAGVVVTGDLVIGEGNGEFAGFEAGWKPNFDAALKMYKESLVPSEVESGIINAATAFSDAISAHNPEFWQKAPREYDHYITLRNGTGFGDYYKLQGSEYVNQSGGTISQDNDNVTITYRWANDAYLTESHSLKSIKDIADACGFDGLLPGRIYDAIASGKIHNVSVINE